MKFSHFFKGMAMGAVDIVPGVSGSTVAVLLGIYERFIAALKNIDGKLLHTFGRLFTHKFNAESRSEFVEACKAADLPWLLVLLAGLATSFVLASLIIPTLMANYPQQMRGFFFGLVLGSIITPIRQIQKWHLTRLIAIVFFAATCFILLGQQFTPPMDMTPMTADGTRTLSDYCTTSACALSPNDIASLPQNTSLNSIQSFNPLTDTIPPNTIFFLPSLPYLFCIFAGFLAICAMLLPGISGSFILLVFGTYYFMLNTGKGFFHALAHGTFLGSHLLYICCFALGALIGIALFSRILTWLFKRFHDLTLAAIIGILLGCLRAIWPFKVMDESGNPMNFIPSLGTDSLFLTILLTLCALGIVITTIIIQNRVENKAIEKEP